MQKPEAKKAQQTERKKRKSTAVPWDGKDI
jgi:hypothetical protein